MIIRSNSSAVDFALLKDGKLIELNKEIVDKTGVTAITITHDINSTRMIGDEVALLDSGIIQWAGEMKELDKSKNKMVEQFINGHPDGPISNNY